MLFFTVCIYTDTYRFIMKKVITAIAENICI